MSSSIFELFEDLRDDSALTFRLLPRNVTEIRGSLINFNKFTDFVWPDLETNFIFYYFYAS